MMFKGANSLGYRECFCKIILKYFYLGKEVLYLQMGLEGGMNDESTY